MRSFKHFNGICEEIVDIVCVFFGQYVVILRAFLNGKEIIINNQCIMKKQLFYETPSFEIVETTLEMNFLATGGYDQPVQDDDEDPLFS